ncbi:MAG: hypothetical protein WAR76_12220 [Xanthobacteraceae bacterium]
MSKRILVVEDQEDNRQIIRDMLAATDYEITEAENGYPIGVTYVDDLRHGPARFHEGGVSLVLNGGTRARCDRRHRRQFTGVLSDTRGTLSKVSSAYYA